MRSIDAIIRRSAVCALCTFAFSFTLLAQSTDPNFPTAVTTNEINGTIKVRDIGDSRLTSYFYTFDGGQGDVFINVVTQNFSGDIDVFEAEALRPLTKMVIYSETQPSETGRLIYLRKPERLVLRIEGRSPNDDPAMFKIKFGGSFIALAPQKAQDAPSIKGGEVNAESGIRVNSVGTIVEVLPKPTPSPKATPEPKEAVAAIPKKPEPAKTTISKAPPKTTASKPPPKKETKTAVATGKVDEKKPVATKPKPPAKTSPAKETAKVEKKDPATPSKKPKTSDAPEVKTVFGKSNTKKPESTKKTSEKPKPPPAPPKESKPDPMANIRLVVQLKDGNVIERPMNEVDKFTVDDGVLTVRSKDGTSVKYSMLEVAKVTIE